MTIRLWDWPVLTHSFYYFSLFYPISRWFVGSGCEEVRFKLGLCVPNWTKWRTKSHRKTLKK
jgi:hypothetical protein